MFGSRSICFVLVSLLASLAGCSIGSSPELTTGSVLLDFGQVAIGESAEATLTIQNEGGAAAVISAPSISGEEGGSFSLLETNWPMTVESGEALDLVLVFTPASSGVSTAQVEVSTALSGGLSGGVESPGGASLSVAVALLGQGYSSGNDDDSASSDDGNASGGDDDDGGGGSGTGSGGPDEPGDDSDGDGFSDEADGGTDCDDSDPTINPSSYELCDGLDNDCDGETDEEAIDGQTWYLDSDSDGYGGSFLTAQSCDGLFGYVDNADDCDDLETLVYPGATELCNGVDDDCDGDVDEGAPAAQTWYLDNDGDGVGGFWLTQSACSMPEGYAVDSSDCDDTNAAIYPSAPELCDGLDNDCDNSLGGDEIDDDGDGVSECSQDCDDSDILRFPGSEELCDGIDNDCDDSTTAVGGELDEDSDTALGCEDCDDDPVTGPAVYPGAAELCDGVDNDCDGTVDVGASDESVWYFDADGDSYGGFLLTQQACDAPTGYVASSNDCAELDANSFPGAPEVCDGVDNDCNGQIDEGSGASGTTWYADTDSDGYGDQGTTTTSCSQPIGFVSNDLDCDDGNSATNPSSYEICDDVDNNCVDGADEAGALDADDWYVDVDGDGYGVVGVSVAACDQPTGYADNFADCDDDLTTGGNNYPGNAEICDGEDNDCDNDIDEDFDQDSDGAFDDTDAGCIAAYTASSLDCDDDEAGTQPGAIEDCGDGIDQDCDGSDLICFTTVVFTTCSATGRFGPSQADCDSAYAGSDLFGAVTVTGGIQQWTVPATDLYTIQANGARGGDGVGLSASSNMGAIMQGNFELNAGDVLNIVVGQNGGNGVGNCNCGGGGGGGSFVYTGQIGGTGLLLAAGGGGGGAGSCQSNGSRSVGNTSESGYQGGNGSNDNNSRSGPGGQNGQGGSSASLGGDYNGGGGAGWYSTGQSHSCCTGNGGGHWTGGKYNSGNGGFGGGAGPGDVRSNYSHGAGGGGGYSGGGGAYYDVGNGGGGGSYNGGTLQINQAGANISHGQVTISLAN